MKSQVLQDLKLISDMHSVDTDVIVDFIETQSRTISSNNDRIEELENEVSDLQDEVGEKLFEYPDGFIPNIILDSALGKMFTNIRNIPADKLDEFVDIYTV